MSTSKTIYLCCGGQNKAGLKPRELCRQQPSGGITRNGLEVTVGLQRAQPVGSGREVTIRLMQDVAPPRSVYCAEEDPGMEAGRERVEELYGDESLRDYYAIRWTNPEHCHWQHTVIEAQGAAGDGDIARPVAVSMPGVPSGDMDADNIIPGAGEEQLIRLTDIRVVPGEYLSPETRYLSAAGLHLARGVGVTMQTPCLCGGRVKSVSEDDAGRPLYTVGVVGPGGALRAEAVLYSSDWVSYRVGDWVYVLLPSSDCLACDLDPDHDATAITTHETGADEGGADEQETDEKGFRVVQFADGGAKAPEDYQDVRDTYADRSSRTPERGPDAVIAGGIIVPLLCGRYKSESPSFDPWEVSTSDLIEMLDFCVRKGVVIEVLPGGWLDVEMPEGRVTLQAHYHCPGSTSTSGGFRAFRENDEVLVIGDRKTRSTLAVLSHADGVPRPCTEYLVVSTGLTAKGGRTFFTVFDLLAGAEAADIPDGEGGFVSFPCQAEALSWWLAHSQTVDIIDEMDNLNGAERLGSIDTAGVRWDNRPPADSIVGELECILPNACDTIPIVYPVGDETTLGGACGACSAVDSVDNPHAGTDSATYGTDRAVAERVVGEDTELDYAETTTWSQSVPWVRTPSDSGTPPRPSSIRCVWGDFEHALQVEQDYSGELFRELSTDGNTNLSLFSETVEYAVRLPTGHTISYSDDTTACRRVTSDHPITGGSCGDAGLWTWRDRYLVLAGFGVRTSFSAAEVYAAVTRAWHRLPYTDATGAYVDGDFQFDVRCGADYSPQNEAMSPFSLPASVGLRSAIEALLQAAFNDVDWPADGERVTSSNDLIADVAFSWEVRA